MINAKRDFHTHATAYRDGNPKPDHTVNALINRAVDLGLSVIGVIEHLNDSPKHPTKHIEALTREFRGLRPRIECYIGAEVDIVDRSGNVTCSPGLKEELGLDYLLAAVHISSHEMSRVEIYVEEELRRHIHAMRNCLHVDVCAHPWESGARLEKAGELNEQRRLACAAMCARAGRGLLLAGPEKAARLRRQAYRMHPSGGRGIVYSPKGRLLTRILGDRMAERIICQLRKV